MSLEPNKTASYKYVHPVWSNRGHVIIMNSNESSHFTLCHLYTLEGKYYCVLSISSLFTQACSTERLPHKHTTILSSASCTCTLTPPCPCKAEPCYNKIQGYTVAQCCQTPSECHLKDLLVFCSPADMIKLELQLALQQKCTCCTDTAIQIGWVCISKSVWTMSPVFFFLLHFLLVCFFSFAFIRLEDFF